MLHSCPSFLFLSLSSIYFALPYSCGCDRIRLALSGPRHLHHHHLHLQLHHNYNYNYKHNTNTSLAHTHQDGLLYTHLRLLLIHDRGRSRSSFHLTFPPTRPPSFLLTLPLTRPPSFLLSLPPPPFRLRRRNERLLRRFTLPTTTRPDRTRESPQQSPQPPRPCRPRPPAWIPTTTTSSPASPARRIMCFRMRATTRWTRQMVGVSLSTAPPAIVTKGQ